MSHVLNDFACDYQIKLSNILDSEIERIPGRQRNLSVVREVCCGLLEILATKVEATTPVLTFSGTVASVVGSCPTLTRRCLPLWLPLDVRRDWS